MVFYAFVFLTGYVFKKICVDTLPTSRASVYALQNLYLAW